MRLLFKPNVIVGLHESNTTLVVCDRFLNVQTSNQRGKNGSWSGGGLPWYNRHNG